MTDREKAIVMAHTGVCMLAGEKFGVFHAYIEDIMGRPVYTHELAIQSISDEIKEKSRDDFIKLCKEEQEPCEDAISRTEVIKSIDEREDVNGKVDAESVRTDIALMSSVKPQEPCEDAISRVEALKVMCDKCPMYNCVTKCSSYRHIEKMAPVNPQLKTGHWIVDVDRWGDIVTTVNGYKCSECNAFNTDKDNYCPNCGAKMESEVSND